MSISGSTILTAISVMVFDIDSQMNLSSSTVGADTKVIFGSLSASRESHILKTSSAI